MESDHFKLLPDDFRLIDLATILSRE